MANSLLEVKNLKKYYMQPGGLFSPFKTEKRIIPAVEKDIFLIKGVFKSD